jgi:hypothetical protein
MSNTKNINEKLDLSKVSNVDAVKELNKELKIQTNSFFPTEIERVRLPSKGLPYKNSSEDQEIQNGFINIREMKGHDEKLLSTPRFIKEGSLFRRILDNCIVSNMNPQDLITTDFNYLLFALRSISYGDLYKFQHKCVSSSCEKSFQVESKISEITWEELPDNFEEPIKIKLPKSKYVIELILPRQYHVEQLQRENLKEHKSTETDGNSLMIKKFVFTTLSIIDQDGNSVPDGPNKSNWEKFYTDLSGMDLAEIREKTKFNTEIEGKEVICPYCGEYQKASLPIGADFFRL